MQLKVYGQWRTTKDGKHYRLSTTENVRVDRFTKNQKKHFQNTREPGKSYFTLSNTKAKLLVQKSIGKGTAVKWSDGSIREIVKMNGSFGKTFINGKETQANAIMIHYSKDGVHAYPVIWRQI